MQFCTDAYLLLCYLVCCYVIKSGNSLYNMHVHVSDFCPLSTFRGGGIAYLIDPDSYAGWSFYTTRSVIQVRQVEG